MELPPVAELGERPSGLLPPGAAEEDEEGEDGAGFVGADVADLAGVAGVPAEGGPSEAVRFFLADEEGEFEGFGEADVFEFGGGGCGFEQVAVVEGSAEARPRAALRGHERMFSSSDIAWQPLGLGERLGARRRGRPYRVESQLDVEPRDVEAAGAMVAVNEDQPLGHLPHGGVEV